jgi:phosphotransacetylase
MKQNNYPQDQKQRPVSASWPAGAADINENGVDFAPSADEVARRAYFSYVNQGSPQGRDVQHWLEAEAHLLAERNLTRVHGFHNRT